MQGEKVKYVNVSYPNLLKKVISGDIDATVWNKDEIFEKYLDINYRQINKNDDEFFGSINDVDFQISETKLFRREKDTRNKLFEGMNKKQKEIASQIQISQAEVSKRLILLSRLIKEKLYKEYFWSQSFCLLTTGGASIDTIKEYIETQGMKHGN